ncbi:MAG: aminotransferase class V-fold PLP-dependent enzyme [Candidatus Wallbacteria bacterium]
MNFINFDNCVTRRMPLEVLEYYFELLKRYNGIGLFGLHAAELKKEISEARSAIASLINAEPDEIIFTSSGTEANNLAIKGVAAAYLKKGRHIITTPFEHSSVLFPLKTLSKNGFIVDEIKFSYNIESQILTFDPEYLKSLFRDTILVSCIYANLDAGILLPVDEICKISKINGILSHVDACSVLADIPIDVKFLNCDLLSLSCHKFGGPQSVGVLYKKKGTRIFPQIEGGIEENGLRGGFYNTAAIAASGFLAKIIKKKYEENKKNVLNLKQALFDILNENIKDILWISNMNSKLHFYLSFYIPGVDNEVLLNELSTLNIKISSMPICSIFAGKIPAAFEFIGITPQKAQNYFRICLSADNTFEEVKYFCEKFIGYIKKN